MAKDELITEIEEEINNNPRSSGEKLHLESIAEIADELRNIYQDMKNTGITPHNVDLYRQMIGKLCFNLCDEVKFYQQAFSYQNPNIAKTELIPDYEKAKLILESLDKQMKENGYNP
jgi:hypothetical protein